MKAADVTNDQVKLYVLDGAATILARGSNDWLEQFPGLSEEEADALRPRLEREHKKLIASVRRKAEAVGKRVGKAQREGFRR
jgi:hypothetical protein